MLVLILTVMQVLVLTGMLLMVLVLTGMLLLVLVLTGMRLLVLTESTVVPGVKYPVLTAEMGVERTGAPLVSQLPRLKLVLIPPS